jgi:hypothetical protein
MSPMPVPPPVTTALKSLSWKSSEALNCELADMVMGFGFEERLGYSPSYIPRLTIETSWHADRY